MNWQDLSYDAHQSLGVLAMGTSPSAFLECRSKTYVPPLIGCKGIRTVDQSGTSSFIHQVITYGLYMLQKKTTL